MSPTIFYAHLAQEDRFNSEAVMLTNFYLLYLKIQNLNFYSVLLLNLSYEGNFAQKMRRRAIYEVVG